MKKIRKKVLDITTKIVLLSPEQGKLKRLWLKFYANYHNLRVIDIATPLSETMKSIYFGHCDSLRDCMMSWELIEVFSKPAPIIIPAEDWHTKRIKPLSNQFDYALKVLMRTPRGIVLSSTWQLKLSKSSAHLIVISSYPDFNY